MAGVGDNVVLVDNMIGPNIPDLYEGPETEMTDEEDEEVVVNKVKQRGGDGELGGIRDNISVNSNDTDGGCDIIEAPPGDNLKYFDQVGQIEGEDKEKGNCCQRCGRGCRSCLLNCCHDCRTLDKVLFVLHIVLIFVGVSEAIVATISKMTTHNQCFLKARYHTDGSMDYSKDLYWCDLNLYGTLVTMGLAFLFIMVNWTAQLNTNTWWMWIKLFLHLIGLCCKVTAGLMLLLAYFGWCSTMINTRLSDPDSHVASNDDSCLDAARYFDEDKNHENVLRKLYTFTIISLGLSLLCGTLWLVIMVLNLSHFWEEFQKKKDQHEEFDDEDEDDTIVDGENIGYIYPPYDETLRQRHNVLGNLPNLQVNGAAGGMVVNNNQVEDAAVNVTA